MSTYHSDEIDSLLELGQRECPCCQLVTEHLKLPDVVSFLNDSEIMPVMLAVSLIESQLIL